MELPWSPRHANIKGNKLVDQLAKKVVEEVNDVENLQAIPSFGDVKMDAKVSGHIKWQERSETKDRGRNLYTFRPDVGHPSFICFNSREGI